MRRAFILTVGLLLACAYALAAPVSEAIARGIAERFMQEKVMGSVSTARPAKAPRRGADTQSDVAYYVFNAQQDKGFVIVSGDDRTEAVLGYSTTGHFDADDVPENMRWWLSQYEQELDAIDAGLLTIEEDTPGADQPHRASTASVFPPLIKSQWGQRAPFNFQCPTISGTYCVAGCVATAMAQIMYYHQWPSSTSKAIPSYTRGGTTYNSLSTTTFNWSAMKDYYPDTETSTTATANAAVARLMRYCGQAVEMTYGTTASNADNYGEVFVEYFRYSTKARKLMRCDYSYSQWQNFILTELEAKRPVMYGGIKHSGGHSFICDGYDGKGYYHFNWGWYGNYDGYFRLTSINPSGGGTGSAVGNNGYALAQDIVIGLEPNTVSTSEKNSVTECYALSTDKTTYTRESSNDPFVIEVRAAYENSSLVERTYNLGWGVYREDGHTRYQFYGWDDEYTLGYCGYAGTTKRLNFGKGFSNGTYYLRPMSRESGNSAWLPCHNSAPNSIKAVVNGNALTLSVSQSGTTEGVTASIYSYGSIRKVGRPLEVTLNVKNQRITDYVPFYLFANGELVGANTLQITAGASGKATIGYPPTTAGTNTIKVTSDKSGNNVYCTGSVNVENVTEGDLTITYTVPTANSAMQISGSSFQVLGTIKNNKSIAYNDYIVARLYKQKSNSSSYGYLKETNNAFNISGNGSTSQYFTFSNLEPGKYVLPL